MSYELDSRTPALAEAMDRVRERRDPTTLIDLWVALGRARREYPNFDLTPALDQLSEYVGNAPTAEYRDERMCALVLELAKRSAARIAPAGVDRLGRGDAPAADDPSAPLAVRLLAACEAGNEVFARTLVDCARLPGQTVLMSLGPTFEALSRYLFQGRPCDRPHPFLGEGKGIGSGHFTGSARPGS
jgi:hypothetical protein